MTDKTMNHDESSEVAALHRRLSDLNDRLGRANQDGQRRNMMFLGLGVLLVAVYVVCLWNASRQMTRLDPQTVAQLGRTELESHLPDGRQMTRDYLIQESPRLVASFVDTMAASVPKLRETAQAHINQTADNLVAEFEQRLILEVRESVAANKRAILKNSPGLTDADTMRQVMATLAADFNETLDLALERTYPQFAHHLASIENEFDTLQEDRELLTRRERIEREIIELLICLVLREGYTGTDDAHQVVSSTSSAGV